MLATETQDTATGATVSAAGACDVRPITERALLVSFSATAWSGRRLDKRTSCEVTDGKGASRAAARVTKHLLADAPELARVVKAHAAARGVHRDLTLPWCDDGWRLVSTEQWLHYTAAMREQEAACDAAEAALFEAWPRLVAEAPRALGALYDARDYPGAAELRSRFAREMRFAPIPTSDDVRVVLPNGSDAKVRASIDARVTEAVQAAAQDAWSRLAVAVGHIRERLADPENVFRDSLIDGARELCDTLSRLNVTGDPALDEARELVERELLALDAKALREDNGARKAVADKAAEILAAMSWYAEVAP